VELPDKAARQQYLEMKLGKLENHKITQEMIERLAARSPGMSLANLEMVLNTALRNAVKQDKQLDDEILSEAFELTMHGAAKDWGADYMERIARHEAGHAYLSHLSGSTPTYVTIVSRGSHGGYMEHRNDAEQPILTKDALLGRIRSALGGRAAELVYYGKEDGLSSGAANDLKRAGAIAHKLVCEYGMDEKLGFAAVVTENALARDVAQRVSEILSESLGEAIRSVEDGKSKIDLLVASLLEKNKLTQEEIEWILI
jgi:ATP-dependent Zn protease